MIEREKRVLLRHYLEQGQAVTPPPSTPPT